MSVMSASAPKVTSSLTGSADVDARDICLGSADFGRPPWLIAGRASSLKVLRDFPATDVSQPPIVRRNCGASSIHD